MAPIKFNGLHIHHPGARERDGGAESYVVLAVTVGQSGVLHEARMTEDDLLRLARDAANYLLILARMSPVAHRLTTVARPYVM